MYPAPRELINTGFCCALRVTHPIFALWKWTAEVKPSLIAEPEQRERAIPVSKEGIKEESRFLTEIVGLLALLTLAVGGGTIS